MLPARRREQILKFLHSKQSATFGELSKSCKVSAVTVRQDLNHLAREGLFVRTHGVEIMLA